jgi:hypothetical protein
MRHLKKFENSEYDGYQSDILVIKDILLSLKDEYPDITGDIYPFNSIDKKIKGITLKINTNNLLSKEDIFSIEYSNLKLDLIKSILESLERIEKALNKKCRVINIWDHKIQINIV